MKNLSARFLSLAGTLLISQSLYCADLNPNWKLYDHRVLLRGASIEFYQRNQVYSGLCERDFETFATMIVNSFNRVDELIGGSLKLPDSLRVNILPIEENHTFEAVAFVLNAGYISTWNQHGHDGYRGLMPSVMHEYGHMILHSEMLEETSGIARGVVLGFQLKDIVTQWKQTMSELTQNEQKEIIDFQVNHIPLKEPSPRVQLYLSLDQAKESLSAQKAQYDRLINMMLSYHELFADLVATLVMNDSDAIKKNIEQIYKTEIGDLNTDPIEQAMAGRLPKGVSHADARSFSKNPKIEIDSWTTLDPHLDLAPSRIYIGSRLKLEQLTPSEKNRLLQAVKRSIFQILAEFLPDVPTTYHENQMPDSLERNLRFINLMIPELELMTGLRE